MSATRVAIIVLNYRGEEVLLRCLRSLKKAIGLNDRILVVDNGHESELMNRVKVEFPDIEILVAPTNRGFAAGMNLGIRQMQARGSFDAFWLINNDASVASDALTQLKRAFEALGSRALFSPVIFSGRGIWYAGGKIDFLRMRTVHRSVPISMQQPFTTDFITGCALFIPQAVIARQGLFDERYFLYYEDAAYSLAARRSGVPLWVVPQAQVFHSEESRNNPMKTYWLVRSGVEFFLRESRDVWWGWVRFFLFFRRLKNWFENTYRPKPIAAEVKRAYTDASL